MQKKKKLKKRSHTHTYTPRRLSTNQNKWRMYIVFLFNTYWLDDGTDLLWTFPESMDYRWPAQFYVPAIVFRRRLMSHPLNHLDRINFESPKQYYPTEENNSRNQFTIHVYRMMHAAHTCVCVPDEWFAHNRRTHDTKTKKKQKQKKNSEKNSGKREQ